MNSQLFDDCDAEVWACFPENFQGVKEFTCSPPGSRLIKPVPVRLEPPFPWDCEQDNTVDNQVLTNRASAFIPVPKTIDSEVGCTRRQVPQKAKAKDTQLSKPVENRNAKPAIPSNGILQKQLLLAFSELTSLRADLRAIKHQGQSIEQKNKKLQTRIGKYKEENFVLRKKYESLVEESARLKSEMARLKSGHGDIERGQGDGVSEGLGVKKNDLKALPHSAEGENNRGVKSEGDKEMVPGKCIKNQVSASVSAKKDKTVAVTVDSVEQKKKNKKRSVFKQLRKAFRKMTA